MNKKKILITIGSCLAAAALAGGIAWFVSGRNSSTPVYVYNFDLIGMTEFWGDSQNSYGPVRTDRIQNILLSDTQTVTEIAVSEGDHVKKGDLLLSFDTTLSDLHLERKRLEVEKLKLQLEDEIARLAEIRNMQPMKLPGDKPDEKESQGSLLKEDFIIYPKKAGKPGYDGSSKDLPLLCWIKKGYAINTATIDALRERAYILQEAKKSDGESDESDTLTPVPPVPDPTPVPPKKVDDVFVIFKQTINNRSRAERAAWQGLHIRADGSFSFFDAYGIPDYSLKTKEDVYIPGFDYGSGYTAAQITDMRIEQEKTIHDAEFKIRMTEAEYKIMKTELSDGNIYAQFDGTVVSLLPEEEARMSEEPVLKLSGGGGFYIDGNINELDRELMVIGQEVTVSDFRNGMTYTGTVSSISDNPVRGEYSFGSGNPNASYYPFTVFVDESANLIADTYVEIQYSVNGSGNGIYLENPFLRTENGRSFVYIQGENGRLERRDVVTGKYLWGSYTEIRDGITASDKIAFPYGKNVKPGAATIEGDYSNLYE